jgi:hypothetical protein
MKHGKKKLWEEKPSEMGIYKVIPSKRATTFLSERIEIAYLSLFW